MNVPLFVNLNLERSLNVLESFISTVKVILEAELLSVYCRCNKKTASLILKNVPISFVRNIEMSHARRPTRERLT